MIFRSHAQSLSCLIIYFDRLLRTRAELFKLKIETEKIKLEANELIRNRIAPERTEIRDLLILFERAAFDAPFYSEEPSAMYRAIQQTRISLQTAGASLASNQEVAESFRAARKSILDVEYQIESRFPKVAQLAHELGDQPVTPERRSKVEQVLGQESYWESVRLMMRVRQDISPHIEKIREVLRELDKQMKLQ